MEKKGKKIILVVAGLVLMFGLLRQRKAGASFDPGGMDTGGGLLGPYGHGLSQSGGGSAGGPSTPAPRPPPAAPRPPAAPPATEPGDYTGSPPPPPPAPSPVLYSDAENFRYLVRKGTNSKGTYLLYQRLEPGNYYPLYNSPIRTREDLGNRDPIALGVSAGVTSKNPVAGFATVAGAIYFAAETPRNDPRFATTPRLRWDQLTPQEQDALTRAGATVSNANFLTTVPLSPANWQGGVLKDLVLSVPKEARKTIPSTAPDRRTSA